MWVPWVSFGVFDLVYVQPVHALARMGLMHDNLLTLPARVRLTPAMAPAHARLYMRWHRAELRFSGALVHRVRVVTDLPIA